MNAPFRPVSMHCHFLTSPLTNQSTLSDWRMTDYSPWNNGTKVESIPEDKRNMVVPLVFQYLTPKWVAFIGMLCYIFVFLYSLNASCENEKTTAQRRYSETDKGNIIGDHGTGMYITDAASSADSNYAFLF